jgi:mRNA-degrading endonuclease RelE of RelBE toxin-antitoxin system
MYSLDFSKKAMRDFEKLPKSTQRGILPHLLELQNNPCKGGTKKLKITGLYRIRVGAYRIIYSINDMELLSRP